MAKEHQAREGEDRTTTGRRQRAVKAPGNSDNEKHQRDQGKKERGAREPIALGGETAVSWGCVLWERGNEGSFRSRLEKRQCGGVDPNLSL